jgi:hypothetical protein
MEFIEIAADAKVWPGEYVLHEPSQEIVMCGAFNRAENFIRAIGQGRSMEDKIDNFKKILVSQQDRRENRVSSCKGCKG